MELDKLEEPHLCIKRRLMSRLIALKPWISLQVMYGARQARRAPSLHQKKAPVKANSTEASDKSDINTLDLKEVNKIREKGCRR